MHSVILLYVNRAGKHDGHGSKDVHVRAVIHVVVWLQRRQQPFHRVQHTNGIKRLTRVFHYFCKLNVLLSQCIRYRALLRSKENRENPFKCVARGHHACVIVRFIITYRNNVEGHGYKAVAVIHRVALIIVNRSIEYYPTLTGEAVIREIHCEVNTTSLESPRN